MPPFNETTTTTAAAAAAAAAAESPNVGPFRRIQVPLRAEDSLEDDDIVERLAYQRCNDEDFDSEAAAMVCEETARESCGRFAAFQERFLGPLSPERAPASWMILNAFCLSWSLSLAVYLTLMYYEYGNEIAASKATTTEYLVYSLTTTLVWVVEIYLRTAFPGLDTILVVSTPTQSDDEEANEEPTNFYDEPTNEEPIFRQQRTRQQQQHHQPQTQQQLSRTFTAEESVVTLETIVQRRSRRHLTALIVELVLAVFFGIESVMDCWNHWKKRHGALEMEDSETDDDYYYMYDDSDDTGQYSMLQQQSDIWINVLAYTYMTYHTYHQYYRAKTTSRDIQRSVSSTLLSHQQYQLQHLKQQQQQSPTTRPRYPQQDFPRTEETNASPNATIRTTFVRSAKEDQLSDAGAGAVLPRTDFGLISNPEQGATLAMDNNGDTTAAAAASSSSMQEEAQNPEEQSLSVSTQTGTLPPPPNHQPAPRQQQQQQQ